MRNLRELDRYRDRSGHVLALYGTVGDDTCGMFHIPSPVFHSTQLLVIASCGEGWEHVSVSKACRCPTWEEMEGVKRMFFRPHEVCMQLHVGESDHINVHNNCLHIWRPVACDIPLPPKEFV